MSLGLLGARRLHREVFKVNHSCKPLLLRRYLATTENGLVLLASFQQNAQVHATPPPSLHAFPSSRPYPSYAWVVLHNFCHSFYSILHPPPSLLIIPSLSSNSSARLCLEHSAHDCFPFCSQVEIVLDELNGLESFVAKSLVCLFMVMVLGRGSGRRSRCCGMTIGRRRTVDLDGYSLSFASKLSIFLFQAPRVAYSLL